MHRVGIVKSLSFNFGEKVLFSSCSDNEIISNSKWLYISKWLRTGTFLTRLCIMSQNGRTHFKILCLAILGHYAWKV